MIKLFKVKSFVYTPFNNEHDLKYFSDNGLVITNNISEADLLISQNFKHLKKFFWFYLNRKKYLVWTHEPRFDVSFSPVRNLFMGLVKCHFMNVYTKDVFTSIGTFHLKDIKNDIAPLEQSFKLTSKKIVALMSYFKGCNAPAIIYQGQNIDLIAIRSQIAMEGRKRGMIDIIGKGWPGNSSIEDSRDGNWPKRKEEILKGYNFNLCFENTIAPNYVTEKIWDSIGSYCLPIYFGKGTNIYDVFPEKSFIDYANFQSPDQLFDYIEKMETHEFVERLNKCIDVYNVLKNKGIKYNWEKRKESLDKIIEKCHSIVNYQE